MKIHKDVIVLPSIKPESVDVPETSSKILKASQVMIYECSFLIVCRSCFDMYIYIYCIYKETKVNNCGLPM